MYAKGKGSHLTIFDSIYIHYREGDFIITRRSDHDWTVVVDRFDLIKLFHFGAYLTLYE